MARKRLTPRQRELAGLRQQARKARQLAMRKENRIKRELGVNTLGKFQPRIPSLDNIDRYTEKQLRAFIERSEQFRQRNVQFERLGSPEKPEIITRQRWQQFDRQQRQRRQQAQAAFQDIENILIPSKGQTIGQRRKDLTPARAGQLSDNIGTMAKPKRPEQITSLDALEQLEQKIRDYNAGGEHKLVRQKAMSVLDQMDPYFSAYGADDIMDQVRDLTDDQFFALWNISDFANNAASIYENMKNLDDDLMSADKATMVRMTVEQDAAEIRGLIEGVKQIQGTGRRF